jgi:hypothetical protein
MAGQLTATAYVKVSGPLWDGRADSVLQQATRDMRAAIADQGAEMLRSFPMNKSGRARGGFGANLQVLRSGSAIRVRGPLITGVAWTPWLEGTSSRNKTTSFRGYRLFRKTRADLDRKATEIAERELQKYLPQIGGQ